MRTVDRDFYVDDLLKSVKTDEIAVQLTRELIELLKCGGFRLTKWMSNSRKVLAAVPKDERARPLLDLDLDDLPVERALGVHWDVNRDTFRFRVVPQDKPLTKRGLLSTISSLYDPIGFVSPVVLCAKKIMQRLWKLDLQWDDPLPPEELCQWQKWKQELPVLSQIEIPRCHLQFNQNFVQIQLHNFCDASEEGYGMCSYLRFLYDNGSISCSFLVGKSKTAPLKAVTVPRLELQAATLAVKVKQAIAGELSYNIERVVFWTDSKTVLQYIKNETKRFHTYVANRVSEIRSVTDPKQWRHCPGKLNPADYASRGLKATKLSTQHTWWKGPEYLWQPETNWPNCPENEEISEDDPEVRIQVNAQQIVTREQQNGKSSPQNASLQTIVKESSSWIGLQRKVAWLARFCDWVRDKSTCAMGGLVVEELNQAIKSIVRGTQREMFIQELCDLKANKKLGERNRIVKLKPFLVEGIIRVGGRLDNAITLSFDEKHPIILGNHHVSRLIIQHCHERLAHAGKEQTLAETRKAFWILGGRTLTKKIIRSCFKCRRANAKPLRQVMGPLPKSRLIPYNPPFTYSGVDFFGPLQVKRGRGTAKRWGCIITCLTTRAVYLEVAPSLETDDFIMVLRQFISRRGPPEEIRSDRGTNFVGADRELRQAIRNWNENKIKRELQQRGIKWIFNPPSAPHMSGAWERLIQTTKRHLRALIGSNIISEFALRTLFAEIEAIMNSRPITAVSDDPRDLEALTPNHFLLQRKVTGLPPGFFTQEDRFGRKQWRKVQYLADLFWKRWINEYLRHLQEREKWTKVQKNIQVGDLVMIAEKEQTRSKWPLGRVTETFTGKDGHVRSAKVKTANAEFHRPIIKLCVLEPCGNTDVDV